MLDIHSPPDESGTVSVYSAFAVYAMTFIGGLVIYLVAKGMSEFSSYMSGIASWIATGDPMRHMSIGAVADNTSQFVEAKAKQAAIAVATAAVAVATAGAGMAAGAAGAGAGPALELQVALVPELQVVLVKLQVALVELQVVLVELHVALLQKYLRKLQKVLKIS
ncbi:hypothetical protein [Candidatus Bandiella numerosa]|uniref:hypothetical protein n=1 Tax=Candidatus Bandiella numerosa TaxID=2570586 RepID=UPI001F2AEFE5|nr:hypothetical protein [Candidatus Bandiella numerosa]